MPHRIPISKHAARVWRETDRLAIGRRPHVFNDWWRSVLSSDKLAVVLLKPRDIGGTANAVQLLNPENDFCWHKPNQITMWCSFEYKHILRTAKPQILRSIPGTRFVKGETIFYPPQGGEVWTCAAGDPAGVQQILGLKEPDNWIFDEPEVYHPDFFPLCEPNFRPGVRRWYGGTPRAATYFQDLVERIAPADPDYFSLFRYPFSDDGLPIKPPHLTQDEWMDKIERMRLTLPESMFEREVLMQWGGAEGAVFRHVEAARSDITDIPGSIKLALLIDWARDVDYVTVGLLGRLDEKMVLWVIGRWTKVEYDESLARIATLIAPYLKQIIGCWHDATGGDGKAQSPQLRAMGLQVHETIWSKKEGKWYSLKDKMVYDASLIFDRRQYLIAKTEHQDITISEHLRYMSKPAATPGRSTYAAPDGMHDDTVSLSLMATVAINHLDDTPMTTLHIPEETRLPVIPKKHKSFYTR